MKRYFEFIGSDGKTDIEHFKFWEIWVDGATLRSRYGKIGSNGQTTLKSFDSASDAEAALTKAVEEKIKKGYIEQISAEEELTIEDSLVGLAEQPSLGPASWAATNSLVFSHLIPQRRFAEARLWCEDLINLDVGYESWNARSNLGIVEFESGHTEKAQELFESIIDEDMGPVDEAEEYLELIASGEERELDTRVSWEYSNRWEEIDASQALSGKETPEDIYLRVIKILDIKDMWDEMEESFNQSPAATIYGLASGIQSGFIGAKVQVDREVFVQACADYVFEVIGATRPIFEEVEEADEFEEFASAPLAKFCTECGSPRSAADKFCTSCGGKF